MTLPDYIQSHLQKPFKWGVNDCVLFAIGWLEIATGKDYLSEFKPWKSERAALRKVKKLGGLEAMFDKHLKRIDPNFAKDGDLTIYKGCAALFSGAHIVTVEKDTGLVFISRMEAEAAWAV